jgi:hypothetical protein
MRFEADSQEVGVVCVEEIVECRLPGARISTDRICSYLRRNRLFPRLDGKSLFFPFTLPKQTSPEVALPYERETRAMHSMIPACPYREVARGKAP